MDISIITATYNPTFYILEIAENLQEIREFSVEWIIVDDFSKKKDHITILKSRKLTNIKIIHLDKNEGQSFARNRGVEYSSGDFILFLDDDDLVSSFSLLELLKNSKKRMVKEVFFAPTFNLFVNDPKKNNKNSRYSEIERSNQLVEFIVKPFCHHSGILWPINIFRELGGYNENLRTDEDGELIIRLLMAGIQLTVVETAELVYRHYTGERVSYNDTPEKWRDRLEIIKSGINNSKDIKVITAFRVRAWFLCYRSAINQSTAFYSFYSFTKGLNVRSLPIKPVLKLCLIPIGCRRALKLLFYLMRLKK
jgi:glycosyltransferase involved in cell wall biosynthesis